MPKPSTNVVPLHPATQKQSERKWGQAVMSHGHCILPSILLQAQARLGVTSQEMMVLLQLVEHWWYAEGQVYPSKSAIAERVGLSEKQVQRHMRRLEEARLVKRVPRILPGKGRTSNIYDLSPLVRRLQQIEKDFAEAKKVRSAARKPGGIVANK